MYQPSDYRIEEDLLGQQQVPEQQYWGIHTQRALANFRFSKSSVNDVPELIRGMVRAKKAAAMANRELGTIPKEIAEAIIYACDLILSTGRCMDQFPVDLFQGGAGTSLNMNTNEVLANLALEVLGEPRGAYHVLNPHDHVDKCQSTNDVYPTGFRVATFYSIEHLLAKLHALIDGLRTKAGEFRDVLKMGRTQLQDAVPMTLGQEFNAFAVTLKEEVKNIRRCQELLLEVNLGATAIGTGLNTPKEYSRLAIKRLAELTGYPFCQAEDLVEATSDCGAFVMLHGALKRFAIKLSKICNDLRLLSSGPRAGLGEITLPRLQAGSSNMPAKVNPVIPEVVNQIAFKVVGNDTTVTMAAEAGQLQLNVMEPVIAQCLFESMSLLQNACVSLQEKCIAGISANPEVCLNNVMNSIGIVTYLDPFIGHKNGDRVGRICAETGKSVREVVLELGLMEASELDDVLSLDNLRNPQYKAKLFQY